MPNNNFTKVIKTKVLPIAGAALVAVSVNACKHEPDDNPPPKKDPKLCECLDNEHLGVNEDCNCGADANLCDCTLQEYAKIGGVIPVYRNGTISSEDMASAIQKIKTIYGHPNLSDYLDAFCNKVDIIHVGNGTALTKNGKTLNIGREAIPLDILDFFAEVAEGAYDSTAQIKQ